MACGFPRCAAEFRGISEIVPQNLPRKNVGRADEHVTDGVCWCVDADVAVFWMSVNWLLFLLLLLLLLLLQLLLRQISTRNIGAQELR